MSSMSAQPAAPVPLAKDKAKEAIDHVISTVFEFSPVDTHPIRNALIVQTGLEDDLSIYESWLELDEPSIDALQCSVGKGGKFAPLSQGYITYVKRFKFMIEECQKEPTWDDLNIFALTRLEWRAFSKRYINGQVNTLPIPPPPGTTGACVIDPVVTFGKSIKRDPKDFPTISDIKDWDKYRRGTQATAKVQDVEPPFDPTYVPSAADKLAYRSPPTPSQVKLIVKSSNDEDDGKDAIAAKDTKEAPSIPSSLLAFPTALLSSNEDATGALIIEGDVAEGNLESAENFSHLSLTRALSFMMVAVDPPLSSFHRGHQAFSTVKLKTSPYGETGINENACAPLDVREMTVSSDLGKAFAPRDTGMSFEYCIQVY